MKKEEQIKTNGSTQPLENRIEFSPRVLEILETLEEVFAKIDAAQSAPEKELAYC